MTVTGNRLPAVDLDCALVLVIGDDRYRIEILPRQPRGAADFRVAKQDSAKAPYRVWQGASGAVCCDCQGFRYRQRCRHVNALRKVGLIH
jgi:hypothetical protein